MSNKIDGEESISTQPSAQSRFLELAKYCEQNPELRFWQALRNFSKHNFIYVSQDHVEGVDSLKDTFYMKDV
jgi:hypothetical protein